VLTAPNPSLSPPLSLHHLYSIWMDQYYYVFGFLLLVFIILAVTCAEITIVLCYFQVQIDS
jgi:hypothetical protein